MNRRAFLLGTAAVIATAAVPLPVPVTWTDELTAELELATRARAIAAMRAYCFADAELTIRLSEPMFRVLVSK